MKCEEIIKLSVYFEGKELNPEEVCGGEMVDKGKTGVRDSGFSKNGLPVFYDEHLYQCKSCKTIKIC